jgi:hypothetical protein
MTERHIELTWRCTSCGGQNLGRHLVCTTCGGPKDDSEHYEMPADPSQVASVTDPELIKLATAGRNWRCAYCAGHVRAPDGTCAECGAGRDKGRPVAVGAPRAALFAAHPQAPPAADRRGLVRALVVAGGVGLVALFGVVALALAVGSRPRPLRISQPDYRDLFADVESASWRHRVHVDRWQKVDREGFAETRPPEAFEVKSLGERVHHVDKVPDGTTTETYQEQETEHVTETYSEQEVCGQDCVPLPDNCRQECRDNGNGFATCSNVCTPGGQSCTPRHCTVQKTRTVPHTKMVTKTRVVPRFKDVERMAPYFSWRVWDWKEHRTFQTKGEGFATLWPSEQEIALNQNLGTGEKERERRVASYHVIVSATASLRHTVSPASLDEFLRWKDAACTLRVHRSGRTELVAGPHSRQGMIPNRSSPR